VSDFCYALETTLDQYKYELTTDPLSPSEIHMYGTIESSTYSNPFSILQLNATQNPDMRPKSIKEDINCNEKSFCSQRRRSVEVHYENVKEGSESNGALLISCVFGLEEWNWEKVEEVR